MFCLSSGFKVKKAALAALVKRLQGCEQPDCFRTCFRCWAQSMSPLDLSKLEAGLIHDRLPNTGIVGLCMLHLGLVQDFFN